VFNKRGSRPCSKKLNRGRRYYYMLVAIDQYGHEYLIEKYPRKELLEYFNTTHASNMYVDDANGEPIHIGYVIRGYWLEVYSKQRMKKEGNRWVERKRS
jgi:hypothetical protein